MKQMVRMLTLLVLIVAVSIMISCKPNRTTNNTETADASDESWMDTLDTTLQESGVESTVGATDEEKNEETVLDGTHGENVENIDMDNMGNKTQVDSTNEESSKENTGDSVDNNKQDKVEDTVPDKSEDKNPDVEIDMTPPWLKGGKQPVEYTWDEYQALPDHFKDAFYESFENVQEFIKWRDHALKNDDNNGENESTESCPWETGGKLPNQYTWAEYEALTPDQQMAFQNWFSSVDEFAAWMKQAQGTYESDEEYLPWEHGGKLPSEYTWAEFEALTPGQQMAFQNWFTSIDEFEAWLKQAQGSDNIEDEYLPWEDGGKLPSEYTWAEFEALTPDQQMAFQNWFASIDEFEAWMQSAQGNGSTQEKMPWEEPGAKLPSEYTWAEFEALTPAQQIAFQNWFGGWEEFDKWLQANQP